MYGKGLSRALLVSVTLFAGLHACQPEPTNQSVFVHSFIHPVISKEPLQVHYYYSEALPTTALMLCRS